jgi:DEAD/DEAH box helicase domain-containing protein
MPEVVRQLERHLMLRRRPGGWYWTRAERAVDHIDLRAAGDGTVDIIDVDTGRVLGHVDSIAADSAVHPDAVYLHRGDTYICEELNHDDGEALVRAARPGYVTQARLDASVSIVRQVRSRPFGVGHVGFGEVEVASQVTGYLRRDELTGSVWDETPLDLPRRVRTTTAVWLAIPSAGAEDPSDEALSDGQLVGGAHGAEHALLGLLPMFAPCDRWDVAGWSHVDAAGTTMIYVHDRQAGGAGFAERGYLRAQDWLDAARERVESCSCEFGCPACVISADCGRANATLDKAAAILLLGSLAPPPRKASGRRD